MAEWHQGPWQAIETDDGEWIIKSAYDLVIGQVPSLFTPERERANATVMAAAPDMVETLELIADELAGWHRKLDNGEELGDVSPQLADMHNWATKALAKAKGRKGVG